MAKGSSVNRKKMMEETLECHEVRIVSKTWINTIGFSFPLEFSEVYLMVVAKNMTLEFT